MAPFSGHTLEVIKERSHGRSELSQRTDRPLEASHFDHKRSPEYNTPNNGMRVTVIEHLAYHLYYKDNPEEIGLNQQNNDWSIDAINQRAVTFMYKIGKLDELDDEISEALLMWQTVLT